jgi:hypothetical protein
MADLPGHLAPVTQFSWCIAISAIHPQIDLLRPSMYIA